MSASTVEFDDNVDVFSTFTELENHLKGDASSQPLEVLHEKKLATNEEIRQWMLGNIPYGEVKSADISLCTAKALSATVYVSQESSIPRLNLRPENERLYIGVCSRHEAQAKLKSLGVASFLLYHDNRSDEVNLIFLYLSLKRIFYRFPVRSTQLSTFNSDGQWWEGRRRIFILQDDIFANVNDLLHYYKDHIEAAKRNEATNDPFQAVYSEFDGLEACRLHKTEHGKCCGGRFHKKIKF